MYFSICFFCDSLLTKFMHHIQKLIAIILSICMNLYLIIIIIIFSLIQISLVGLTYSNTSIVPSEMQYGKNYS